jgi:adenylate cyclase
LQDEVTAQIAGAIEPSINLTAIRRAATKPTSNLQAYDYFLRSLGEAHLFTRESIAEAIRLAWQAIAMDPRYAHPRAYIASWHGRRRIDGWMEDEGTEAAEGARLAHEAVQLEPDDPAVLTEAAFAIGHLVRELPTALSWFDRAIALNPNSAFACGRGDIVRNFAGDYVTAAEHAERAIRQSPFDPFRFSFSLAEGNSHLLRKDLPPAVTWLQRAARENPRHSPTFLMLASALAHSGLTEEAGSALQRLQELNPVSSASWHRGWSPYPVPAFEYVLARARMAGLPE